MGKTNKKPVPSFTPWLGVFETLRVENGRAFFAEEHWRSLKAAAQALGLKAQADFRKTLSSLPKTSGRLRWVVEPDKSYAMLTAEPMEVPASFSLGLAPQRLGSKNWDARYKTLSYLTHWQARKSVAADEALLLNENGTIASGAMANIFWVRHGTIYTPSLDAGCRAGVVRTWLVKKEQIVEGFFLPEHLVEADEIFLTNSWIGIRPVRSWSKRKLTIPGPVTRSLQKKYQRELTARNET